MSNAAKMSRVMVGLAVTLLFAVAVSECGRDSSSDFLTGRQWRVEPRYGHGSATAVEPARLDGVAVEEHSGFDRVLFRFDGSLPGYRVAHRAAEVPTLTIDLQHVVDGAARHLDPELPAIRQVDQSLSPAGTVHVAVRLAQDVAARLPFRVGLLVGAFYVDVAHPDAVMTLGS